MKQYLPRPGRRLAWLLLIPLLLACQFVTGVFDRDVTPPAAETLEVATVAAESAASATAAPSPSATAQALVPPTPPISPSPTGASPRLTAEPSLLPAPLYFIGENRQIMRLEADGIALQQITDVAEGILNFDVSPVDGRLVYVSGNKLVETGPNGDNPIVKVDAGQIVIDETRAPSEQARMTQTIDNPRFSPDGGQIAFGLNGVNLILAGGATEYATILPSDPYPEDPNASQSEAPIRFFWPASWSPDGRRLLLLFGYYPEGGGLAILDLLNNDWNVVTNPDGIECCDWAWTDDPEIAFLASDRIAYGMPGLAQVSPVTGGSQTLINGAPDTAGVTGLPPSLQQFKAPYAAADGRILVFVSQGYQDDPLQPQFHMAQLAPGANETSPLRDDAYSAVELLWAGDGRGAAIVDRGPASTYPIVGPLRWLPADGGPAVTLPASGGALRWGPVTSP